MTLDKDFLLGWAMDPVVESYAEKDVMFYALSVGVGADPLDAKALRYVYEKRLAAFPTMPTVLSNPVGWALDPRTGLDYRMMVHGEQGLVVHRPLPVSARVRGVTRIVDVVDKGPGKGALLYLERALADEATGERLATVKGTVFARADGGFSGSVGQARPVHAVPDGPPDAVVELASLPQSALLYRLNGDRNPIHADPEVARSARFPQPILHGLCSYGMAAHAVLKTFGGCEPDSLAEIDARFSAPMFPGETMTLDLWKRDRVVSFRARIAARGALVLDNGRAVIR